MHDEHAMAPEAATALREANGESRPKDGLSVSIGTPL
ncbi:hypothetical protein BFJ70_g7024 [Fusarium oxysporum]|nr:hypothetical protein BFJ70_g7024 [Fusarium oxysporum]